MIIPVFVEFVSINYPRQGAKHYFVGSSVETILMKTDGGKKFGSAYFSSHRQINEDDARTLGLEFRREYDEVRRGYCLFAKIMTPHT